jgi:hypothetical protein
MGHYKRTKHFTVVKAALIGRRERKHATASSTLVPSGIVFLSGH